MYYNANFVSYYANNDPGMVNFENCHNIYFDL